MKRRSIILFVIISVICITTPNPSASLKAKGKGEQLLDYDNPLMGVKFSYPANWHISSVHTGYESSRCTEPDIDCYLKLNRYPYYSKGREI